MIRTHFIASGSKGNATLVEGASNALLIDCGITKKTLVLALEQVGCPLSKITHLLVTHEHTDHTKGFGVIMRHFKRQLRESDIPEVLATKETYLASKPLQDAGFLIAFHFIEPNSTIECGEFTVHTIPSSHDAASPLNFHIELSEASNASLEWITHSPSLQNPNIESTRSERDSLAFITDTGFITNEAFVMCFNAGILAIESNHDEKMLKEGPYPYVIKRRIGSSSGHLSNLQAKEALPSLVGPKTRAVVGIHLSETNNTYDLAMESLEAGVTASCGSPHVFHAYQNLLLSVE